MQRDPRRLPLDSMSIVVKKSLFTKKKSNKKIQKFNKKYSFIFNLY